MRLPGPHPGFFGGHHCHESFINLLEQGGHHRRVKLFLFSRKVSQKIWKFAPIGSRVGWYLMLPKNYRMSNQEILHEDNKKNC